MMAINNRIVSKGIYTYPQLAGYVSVKQYIFLRIGEKKHLLLRFSNDLDVAIDFIAFTVSELDADGALIKRSHSRYKRYTKSGESFAIDKAIVVDEKCVDVKVTVDVATSGEYEYSDRGGVVTVRHTNQKIRAKTVNPRHLILGEKEKAEMEERRRKRKIRFVAALAIVSIILINLAYILVPIIIKEYSSRKSSKDDATTAKAYYTVQHFDI